MCKSSKKIILTIFLSFGLSNITLADDIDILSEILPTDSNILFIMDLSGSMQWDLSGVDNSYPTLGQKSRVDVLRGAFQDIINDTDFNDIKIGLSVFSGAYQNIDGWNGGAHGITYPISPIQGVPAQSILSNASFTHPGNSYMPSAGTKNTREYLTNLSSSSLWNPLGGTPIVDALYEGVLYFRGENVDLGRAFPDDVHSAHPSTYTGSLSVVPGSCTTNTLKLTRSDSTGGTNCTTNTETREMCAEGVTSCGLGTNCAVEATDPVTRICDQSLTTISECTTANPTYHSCTVEPVVSCSTDVEGLTTCATTGSQVVCQEDQTRTFCDKTPETSYTCDFQVEQCDPDDTVGTLTYKSPIDSECPSNGIILLTDGMPTSRTRATEIMSLIGTGSCAMNDYDSDGQDDFSSWDVGAGQCGIELADYMSHTDHNLNIPGDQTISLYTIGFSLSAGSNTSAYLYDLADHGGGAFVAASNRAQLTAAFKDAIVGISKKSRSFSAPTYTVDTSTMLTHDRYVYVPVFNRTGGSFWSGNLKKYELRGGELYGKGMVKATDASGQLKGNVSDLWSLTGISKSVVDDGGAANKLNHATRKIFTDNGSSLINIASATAAQLGVSNADKTKLISFIRGEKAGGLSRYHMGDILHSKPAQLMMGGSESIIFIGTNEGYLHAIDSNTGEELFAYMPQELLKNIKPQYNNTVLGTHLYGVDGPLTLFDENGNGVKESGESAALYFGLRRGGKAYYGLDITNPANPTLKWKFTHPKLGYSWSQPTVAKLKYGGSVTPKNVLIFGGGYIDDHHIDPSTPDTDKNIARVAAAVFIINADTGALIAKIAGAELEYAVPSKIKVIDIDRNGSADRLYFTDTGGNILRVDLDPNKDSKIDDYKLTKLASLSGSSPIDKRSFFNEPDVAIFKKGGRVVLTVSVGSGKRPDPLNTLVENFFYVILDEDVYNTPVSSQNITPARLYDAPLMSGDNLIEQLALSGGKRGWKLPLMQPGVDGEKSLSSSITFQNKVMFTTFGITSKSTVGGSAACGVDNTNKSSLYVLDLLTGEAAMDLNNDGSVDNYSDSRVEIGPSGNIPQTPQIIRGGFQAHTGGGCTKTDCTRSYEIHAGTAKKIAGSGTKVAKPIPLNKVLPRAYWLENDQ